MAKSVAKLARSVRAADKKSLKNSQDSFVNFVARLGIGAENQMSAGHYSFDYLTRNRTQLEAAYRTSWIISQTVDAPAQDMTREGVEYEGDMAPEVIDQIESCWTKLKLWQRICEGLRWARLFGGAVGVIMIDGQDPRTPFKLDTVGPGQFKGLLIMDRWLIQPQLTNLITTMGPDMGYPRYYDVVADARALSAQRIHHSRVIRFEGLPLPYYQHIAENMWGESIVEKIHDRIIAFDSGTMGLAQLLYKAHLRTVSIEQLRDIISTGGEAYEALVKQLQMIRFTQSNEGLTVIDAKDKFESHQYSFSGIGDALLQLGQQLSGATDIPLVRLFGQSPTGLNSTGESDLRTYYDSLKRRQDDILTSPVDKLTRVIAKSEGLELPDDFAFHFRPLWILTEQEKSEIANKDVDTVTKAQDAGLVSQKVGMKELKQGSKITGRFTNISTEDIDAADDEVPSASEMLEEENPDEPIENSDPQ